MARLRHDYEQFLARDIEVIAIGPEDTESFQSYAEKESLPFVGLPDPEGEVRKLYGQEVKLLKLGRMPAQVLVDKEGVIRYAHYGESMRDIPENQEILRLADELGLSQGQPHPTDQGP